MRYGRRATAFSTTAVSWVCVLCGAVTAAWVFDLIPHRKPMAVETQETALTTESPAVDFNPELQQSQSEPMPMAASEPANVAVNLDELFIPATLGQAEQSEPVQTEGVVEIAFDQPAVMTNTPSPMTTLTDDQISPAHPMQSEPAFGSAMVASHQQPASDPTAQDPFAAYEAKQRKFEFVAAQGQGAPAQPAPRNEAGWNQLDESAVSNMTMKSTPDAAFLQTASRGGDGFSSPAAANSVATFQPANPHSGQFQLMPANPAEVDGYSEKPGQTPNVNTRTLTFNPERDHVQLLADPYRGGATNQLAQVETDASGIQQTGFSQPANPQPSFGNSSMMTSESRFSTTAPGLPKEVPTQTQLMEKVLGVPGSKEAPVDEMMSRKTPQEEVQRLRTLSELYWSTPQSRPDVQKEIDELSRKIYFSPAVHYMAPYTVQQGDILQTVAKTYNVPWQYLARLNRVTPEKVRAGAGLKVIKGPFSAIVDLSDYELIIHAHGYYVCRFPVATGKNDSTPTGTFSVINKEVNPTYYGPEGVVAADDPANPLGERWIDLGNSIGIHGTIDPDSIGKAMSKGCIRLTNEHVSIVYDLLGVGSEVTIVP
ncbi:L,D-transpeptidase family protein [Lacunimicrobium album]